MIIPEESLQKLLYLRTEIDRIFRDFFDPQRAEILPDGGQLELVLDVYEIENEIFIEAELPGMSRDDIVVSVLRDIIIVEGTRQRQVVDGEASYQCMERGSGVFRRIIEIPGAGDTNNIRAEYKHGVLCIHLPKIQERRGRQRKVPIE